MTSNMLSERLSCTKETKNLMEECIKEFKLKNPDFNKMRISNNFILDRVFNYYLERL